MSSGATIRGRSLTGQAGALASGALAAQAAQVLMLIALTRLVPKAQLGGLQQLGLIYGILSPLLIAGIPAALLYFIPRSDDPARVRAWIGQAYLLLGAIGLAVSIAVLTLRVPLARGLGNPALADALVPYAPFAFFAFVTSVMPTALVSVRRAGLVAALNALGGALMLAAVVGAAVVWPRTGPMAAALTAASAATAVISIYAVRRTVGISLRGDGVRRGLRALLAYGLPLALTGLAGKFAFQFDRLVVSRDFSPALYAVYVIGAVELPITVIVQQSVNSVLIPALTRHYGRGDIAGLAALWRRAIRRTSLVLLPVFVFFMLTADATVQVLFGGSYARSAEIFRIYLLLVPLRVATYGLITQAIGRTRINLTASFVLLAANAALVLALVGPLGLDGPALATVLATLVMAAYYLVRLRRVLDMSIGALFPWRVLAANLTFSALAGIPVLLLVLAGVEGALQLVVAGILYAPCYLALLVVGRRLEPEELGWCRRLGGMLVAVPQRRFAARSQNMGA